MRAKIIKDTRAIVSNSLVRSLMELEPKFSELSLARSWLRELQKHGGLLPTGWYIPPPDGMSVLIGSPADYTRLSYRSLRDKEFWPSANVFFDRESILYPYFSALSRPNLIMGDFVGSFYRGTKPAIKDWLKTVYHATLDICSTAKVGMTFGELHNNAVDVMQKLGASNQTYSLSGGFGADIGHTIPYIEAKSLRSRYGADFPDTLGLAAIVANARQFISRESSVVINRNFAFTVEPQMSVSGLPMASFHFIVVFDEGQRSIVTEFDPIFDYMGMKNWMLSSM